MKPFLSCYLAIGALAELQCAYPFDGSAHSRLDALTAAISAIFAVAVWWPVRE